MFVLKIESSIKAWFVLQDSRYMRPEFVGGARTFTRSKAGHFLAAPVPDAPTLSCVVRLLSCELRVKREPISVKCS